MTALEIQQAFADLAGEFVAGGGAEGIVPGAEEIVFLWRDTLDLCARREVEALARRCDSWLKFLLLDRQRGRYGLAWSSDRMRVADSLFASLDPEVSLFFQAAATGCVERMPDPRTIERFRVQPPDDTRAYFRAHVLRRYGQAVSSIDWSRIVFRVPGSRYWWSTSEIPMPDPRRLTRLETESLFDQCATLEELVEAAHTLTPDPPVPAGNGRPAHDR
jgi:proteasome accessory factor A